MSPTKPFKFNLFSALVRALSDRGETQSSQPSQIDASDIPDYLRKDIGLPAPHRRVKAQDPPRIDPVRHM